MRVGIALIFLALVGGCESLPYKGKGQETQRLGEAPDDWPFRAVSMRVHPFTSLEQAQAGGPVILDARVELLDAHDDPTKDVGLYRFELYATSPKASGEGQDHRMYMWEQAVLTLATHREFYDPITRTYRFELRLDEPPQKNTALKLVVQFDTTRERRLIVDAPVKFNAAKPE